MDAWYHDVVSLITAKIDHFSVPGFLWNGTNDYTLTYQRRPEEIPSIYLCTYSMSLLRWAPENVFKLKKYHKNKAIS